MYNSIHPINIVYRKQQGAQPQQQGRGVEIVIDERAQKKQPQQTPDTLETSQRPRGNSQQDGREFPNGAKVAIDYSKSKINISQVLTDFKSTVLAINAPKEVSDEVSAYLLLVEKESLKDTPSRQIIVSNLKNASRVSDNYITKALNKPSKVVEGWVDALFLQDIMLKADPSHVNPDFRVQLPETVEKTPVTTPVPTSSSAEIETEQIQAPQMSSEPIQQPALPQEPVTVQETKAIAAQGQPIEVEDVVVSQNVEKQELPPAFKEFMNVFNAGKKLSKQNKPKEALVAFSKSIDAAQKTGNVDFKGAAHLERGKIFDRYDHVSYALGEYNEATKCNNSDIKTHAHLKMAQIYDDYAKFEPAVKHYHSAISFSGNNPSGQSRALKGLGTMHARRFDVASTETFNGLAIDVAQSAENPKVSGKIYREVAKDYSYLGENKKALEYLKRSTAAFAGSKIINETNEQIAQNYIEASKVMRELGNEAKAKSLLSKAFQYQSAV